MRDACRYLLRGSLDSTDYEVAFVRAASYMVVGVYRRQRWGKHPGSRCVVSGGLDATVRLRLEEGGIHEENDERCVIHGDFDFSEMKSRCPRRYARGCFR
jgi:hypothetical protein